MLEAIELPDLGAQPRPPVSVSMPRTHSSRRAACTHGEGGSAPAISASSCTRRTIRA
jgi:hypothetical protein